MDFYKALEMWQNVQQTKFKKTYVSAAIDVLKVLTSSSKPIMQSVDFVFDNDMFKDSYRELLLLLKDYKGLPASDSR